MPRHRSGFGGFDQGPQTTGFAGRDTLVIWGGEFGRTSFSQGKLTQDNYGRDHHPGCFTMWMAGGGVKPGFSYGETDEFSYNVAQDPVHVHDFQATLLHLMGIDHEQFDLQVPGAKIQVDGRAWEGGQGYIGLTGSLGRFKEIIW
jgi:uncharacterized protein (DUF1501 family)